MARPELFSTWSWRKGGPGFAPATNAWWLHEALWLYKRFPILQRQNRTYDSLCIAFDRWLAGKLRRETRALYFLSGCGLTALRQARTWNIPVVVDAGSTHTDYQHRIVTEEFRRNGLAHPLFPERYRDRVRTEFTEADFIQIPSTFVRRTFLEAGIPANKILMAPYGVDVGQFAQRSASDLQPSFRVLCPSGVNLRKGARLLVEAWRKLGWHDAELHWIGWPGAPEVRHLFRRPLAGVIWHGWMPHETLASLYRSCDVLVLPSFEEGFARVLVEAAASGLPLIATPNTGVEDFFTPGHSEGWLIEAGSVDALCAALEEAKADRQRTLELGQRAATRARQGFSWEDYGRQVRENLGRVMGS
ncbi:MAG: hypothetical protein OHK005_09050 [Candidatus Methylacidiphilales bacterium]